MSRRSRLAGPAQVGALPDERQRLILEHLRTHGRVIAADFAAAFAISEDSIRRDLRELAAQGLCQRVYGGALPLAASTPLKQRREEHAGRKLALARAAASLVRAGQVLLIDAGSTNSALASALPEGLGLTVITNAPDIAQRLMEREGFAILLIGGRIDIHIGATVGAQALQEVARVRADLCFPGACAVDPTHGLWGLDSEESRLKRAMIEVSTQTVILATDDKLSGAGTHRVAGIEQVHHLVVEASAPRPLCAAFKRRGVKVLRADPA
ncbi:DeoR/GlpR family DNA-binding transcription regulator [uncultured Paludibaculum sp.]|uniref:DeoR/GlpR family DNA-binding transcription regulator n=1 Tax=uncultured Paludibaculum sp. TaxID=1765020 RepID=UPI002AABDA9D|nr:DeoR/GlpR family DNA-binding transcription regulator [uncultured Paludibaculum sp.]